ncbi:MAG: hypothetical protein IKU02_06530 [Bacteroidaceae bacterium]|nr:hypothetical protein [Bacteroidaceae bacterium]MBR4130562.1 hypothetical protein [Bacteroidaceae bacterium]
MITSTLATNKTEFRKYLEQLKVKNKRIFSPDEVEYLADNDGFEAVELKQEDESDEEFLTLFSTWLHERPQQTGHIDYYILLNLRTGEQLTSEQYEYMERNVAECFETNHGWLYELNDRLRFRLRIRLICSNKKSFRRLVRKDWRNGIDITEQ